MIYRAYENAIRNAVKLSPPGSRVEIRAVERRQRHTRDLRARPGAGLAIARRAMQMHGGSVAAALRDGGGLVVTLILPKQWASLGAEQQTSPGLPGK